MEFGCERIRSNNGFWFDSFKLDLERVIETRLLSFACRIGLLFYAFTRFTLSLGWVLEIQCPFSSILSGRCCPGRVAGGGF